MGNLVLEVRQAHRFQFFSFIFFKQMQISPLTVTSAVSAFRCYKRNNEISEKRRALLNYNKSAVKQCVNRVLSRNRIQRLCMLHNTLSFNLQDWHSSSFTMKDQKSHIRHSRCFYFHWKIPSIHPALQKQLSSVTNIKKNTFLCSEVHIRRKAFQALSSSCSCFQKPFVL